MKRFIQSFSGAIFGALIGFAAVVIAQSNPGFVNGQVPTAAQWNSYFSGKLDYPMRTAQTINANAVPNPATGANSLLHIVNADGVPPGVYLDSFTNPGFGASTIIMRRAHGTASAPTAIAASATLGQFAVDGWNGSAYTTNNVAQIQMRAAENFTTVANGTRIDFYTTPNGTTVPRQIGRFDQDASFSLSASNAVIGIGTPANSANGILLASTLGTSGGSSNGIIVQPVWNTSTLTTTGNSFNGYFSLAGSATVSNVSNFAANGGVTSGTPTITNFTGFYAPGVPTGPATITNAYAFRGQYAAASGRFNLYMDGNAINYLQGPLELGTGNLNVPEGALGMARVGGSGSAPGAAGAKFEVVCGTGAGSAKLIMYAGTSATPVTVIDNVGSGVTGC